jgi:hypothetical protein
MVRSAQDIETFIKQRETVLRSTFNLKTLVLFYCLFLLLICSCNYTSTETDTISYNTHIRPILSDKCFKCHGPDEKKRISGYRLDTEEGAFALLKDQTDLYGIVAGHPEKSEIYSRIVSSDPDYMMPPPEENLTLTTEEIELIRKWIQQGAPYEPHWSFVPLKPVKVPELKDTWIRNEIDAFTLQKMQDKSLKPSREEGSERLLKRVLHDLTGLPPTLSEQDAFIADASDRAYEKIVDAALASPHYGEKMAIMWMDIARYADSHGYQDDGLRTMWPWRDWVIHAFNQNYSYEKFVTWQLAGDLIPNSTKEMILATGFNRNHKITQEGGVIDEEYRIEYVTDRTNTFGKALLGMTFECAKCHDHKYDPISQEEYFGVFTFFNQVPERGLYGDISVASLADPPAMRISCEDREGILNFISRLDSSDVSVMIMKDSSVMRPTHILNRGQYDQKGRLVSHMTPAAILVFDTLRFEKNRLGLARWMFDKKNPLTARVFVNAVWQQFFGQGLVKTSGDFGLQGALPSHPELLDWLAYDFMQHDWDIKRLVRKIVLSSTYRQGAIQEVQYRNKDPENIYLSRGPRYKLSAELMNDHVLSSSGLLFNHIGGPSIKPYQPKGLWEAATSGRGQLATYVQDHGNNLYRRGLYHFIKRTVPPPSMLIFDASNRDQCEVNRTNTNTPLQALVMLNDVRIMEASKFMAAGIVKQQHEPKKQLETAFRRIVCRKPGEQELNVLMAYYARSLNTITEDKAKKLLDVGEKEIAISKPAETAALMQAIHVLYNLEETSMR